MGIAHLTPIGTGEEVNLRKSCTDNFDVTPGNIYDDLDDKAANFYHFPYDWRRDNRASARLLKKLVDKRLKRWREASGATDANPLPSVWGKTLIFRWLYPRKLVNLSESDGRALK